MASSCSQAVRQHVCKSSTILRVHLQKAWPKRSFVLNSAADQQPAVSSPEEIVIPKKKTWSKEAVLQALASTVNRDPTASDHRLQDDPYLTPKTSSEFVRFGYRTVSGFQVTLLERFTIGACYGSLPFLRPVKTFLQTYDFSLENNNAERIFALLSEPNTHSYSALIRGMVKHGAYSKAFSTYTDLLNNPLKADVNTFNALITAAPEVKEKYNEKWELILDLLKEMAEQKVKPNLLTLNAVLKALRRCGTLGKSQAFPVISEMKALSIDPSLASYNHLLGIFYKPGAPFLGQTDILQEVMNEVSGKSFTPQDPDDAQFFITAVRICLDTKDIEQAYRVHELLGVGENWRLLGNDLQQNIYYARFFSLLCMMENIDVVLKWYRDLVPSVYYPSSNIMRDLLQALDTDNRLDLIPQIWKDIKQLGHANRQKLVEDLLTLMAREKQNQEVQESFAECALDIKKMYDTGDRGKVIMSWTATSLSDLISVLLAAQRRQDAWEVLKLFKTHNRVPSEELLNKFLTCITESGEVNHAVELVQISAGFCLPETPKLIQRVQQEFQLSEQQKNILSDLEIQTFNSD
ncbi:pentatricopeptide repeat domain-containing protein 3, mitochondrial-like [Sinocyclocheilus rhinocerous]|uniref:pentatricopeptide repeat domain-containing protein 3, mitochondrial-like n=1 Tax=Sinocyclocheilus rhinocerous TaxID=307959 RepID=UPI0007B7ABA1|nr:PREDICTED: pentatricopeptide repeat domain-containing protein 3, mitochondrial-like [Sinocyclocheilus rhinocerous]